MGLGIIRIFKAFKEITDKYEGTIKCSKRLDETLELIKNTWPEKQAKSLYRAGKLRVVKDVNWNTWHEVELQVQAQNPVTKQVVKVVETIIFRVQYYQGVVNQITLDLKAVDSKATYNEFEKALAELEEQLFTQEEYQKHMREVSLGLEAAIKDASSGLITNDFVAQYIDKIFVTLIEDDTAKLEIKIFTGKNTEKWLKKLNARAKGRMGVTSKKMIQSYEANMK